MTLGVSRKFSSVYLTQNYKKDARTFLSYTRRNNVAAFVKYLFSEMRFIVKCFSAFNCGLAFDRINLIYIKIITKQRV